jgi:hypothetical protein
MPATETLVFRARAALKREYERSGGTAFGSGLLGFRLARLGLGRRRDGGVADGVTNAAAADPGLPNLTARLAQFVSTSLPGGEQAVVKALSVAAGVVMAAAATVIPGLNPFADGPAGAAAAPLSAMAVASPGGGAPVTSPAAPLSAAGSQPAAATLKTLLGNAVPADWTPQRASRSTTADAAAPTNQPQPVEDQGSTRMTPLRDAATAVRSADRPQLSGRDDSEPGPLRSILASRPDRADRPERPHLVRALLADPVPTLIDALPIEPLTGTLPAGPGAEPAPSGPAPVEPAAEPVPGAEEPTGSAPVPDEQPTLRDAVPPARDTVEPGDGNVAGHDPALLRRRNG